ncbi:hypothetical protein [Xanthomonas sp. 1678]|uniref:hypothetical protein n=1 Tax=Xanthomonas sp. 1678 TaxID=3158788 RepID=UPI002861371D|nr:hypothetical protein [Xanthomonas translucens]
MPLRISPDRISLDKDAAIQFGDPDTASAIEALATQRFGPMATNEVCNGTNPSCTNTKDCSLGSNTNCNNQGKCFFTPTPGPGQG